METHFVPMTYADTEDTCMGGVCLHQRTRKLQEEGFTREEGEILIENDLLELEQYINGNVYLLKIQLDGEDEYIGSIYPTANTDKKAGRLTLNEDTHIPRDEDLDIYLLQMDISPEDELLVRAASWGLIRPTGRDKVETRQRLMLEETMQQKQESPRPGVDRAIPDAVQADREPQGVLRQPDPGGNRGQQSDRQGLAHPRPGDISQGHSKPHLPSGNGPVPHNP